MSEPAPAVCTVCPRRCRIAAGGYGFCRARKESGGRVVAANYGRITSLALDPIEKKPLAFFRPGSYVLSVGGYGCNLRCPFCQNDSISQHGGEETAWRAAAPDELAALALRLAGERGNIGLAYTYNEPLVGWEFVRDCALEIRRRSLSNVLVSNGCATSGIVEELAPLIDAANIDLKGPSQEFYDWVGGSYDAVCRTIEILHRARCHVEVTMLAIPGRNDSDEAIDAVASRIAAVSPRIPLHVTRFFPRYLMTDSAPTPPATVHRLADRARRFLSRVLTGNC